MFHKNMMKKNDARMSPRLKIAVLIATSGRQELLAARSLPSVRNQTRQPDTVVLVDDSQAEGRRDGECARMLSALWPDDGVDTATIALRNRRTQKSASGAWNSGLDELCRRYGDDAGSWFVAVLDDDDAWSPEYLAECEQAAIAQEADMVISGIIRHQDADDVGRLQAIPAGLTAAEIFVKNPHIQGSNLFVRLARLLEVGGFDENLLSCTDRDLCIRLARLQGFVTHSLASHGVHHYADLRLDRLTLDRETKGKGLRRFFEKHAGDFAGQLQAEFLRVAQERFSFGPGHFRETPPPRIKERSALPEGVEPPRDGLYFVIGVTTDSALPPQALRLFGEIAKLTSHPGVRGVAAVLLENGPAEPSAETKWGEAVGALKASGVEVRWITPGEIADQWSREQAVIIPDARQCRLPIAITRSILNYHVYKECQGRPGAVAWILDDDKTFTFEVRGDDGDPASCRRSPNVGQLLALREQGVDVVIGQDSAAAPLPFEATIRLQMLDLEQALRRQLAGAAQKIPESVARDAAGYYDLSRETRYLETPLDSAIFNGLSGTDLIEKAIGVCRRIRAGESVTRPLMVDEASLPLEAARESIMRGGSTLFFKPEQLMLFTQYSAKVGPTWVRRSDMLHSLIISRLYGAKIVMHAAVAVRHGREFSRPVDKLTDTMSQDILGYGLYRGAQEALSQADLPRTRGICGFFYEPINNLTATVSAKKAIRERLASMELSAWRVQGLVGSCLRHLDGLRSVGCEEREAFETLREELRKVAVLLAPREVRRLTHQLLDRIGDGQELASSYRKLEIEAVVMQSRFKHLRTEQLVLQRAERARKILAIGNEAELLGVGWEGAVFRVGDAAVKLIDIARPARLAAAWPALQRLEQLSGAVGGLCALNLSCSDEGLPIIKRPYLPRNVKERPGIGAFARLLEDCRMCGVVFRNLSPANIMIEDGKITILDYGLDFRLFNQADYESMARKAWLCARFWERPDLGSLLTRSLHEPEAPEMDGFADFWRWYDSGKESATAICDGLVDESLADHPFETLLDYGCGKQALTARRYRDAGKKVVGYDPGSGVVKRWESDIVPDQRLVLTDKREIAMANGPYDVVVCSLVLCELRDEKAFTQVVEDLSAAVRPDGKVVVVICDPVGTFGAPTAIHRLRRLPPKADYSALFDYQEVAESGRERSERHRPIRALKRALMEVGLMVRSQRHRLTFDLSSGLPSTDFLAWECDTVTLPHSSARVSLVIKASALEADTLESQVEHLVDQLESPRPFFEKVLAIDSRAGGFVREHGNPDLSGVLAAAERLKTRGYVDHIVRAPVDGSEQCAHINQRWFGHQIPRSHTAKGAPLASPLGAFEQCRGDYILQVDADLLIRRADRYHDYIGEAIQAIKERPGTFTVSLNILNKEDGPFTGNHTDGRPYRVECRGCLFDRQALLAAAPFPNNVDSDGQLELSWHRSMDQACLGGRLLSLRGGAKSTGFVHPENSFKRSADEWNLVMASIEQNAVFEGQLGKVDLVGGALQWLPPPRREPFVFVVTGRNVPFGKMLRCFESMRRQRGPEWGAVVIDDGSGELCREACHRVFGDFPNITLLQPRRRRGQLANTVTAIRDLCADPSTVIITLDMDDGLIGDGVLQALAKEYEAGADLTVGSMVRTDKPADYPASFGDLHASRGGAVWQHLRSFRKSLFDAIPDWRLRLDGNYVEICVDWAFMVPIAERASSPRYLKAKHYYYETSGLGKADQRCAREACITRLMVRHMPGGPCANSSGLLTKEEIMERDWNGRNGLLILRHADRPSLKGLGERADEVAITEKGRLESRALGQAVGQATAVVSSGVLRARQTAQEIMTALGRAPGSLRTFKSLCRLSASEADRVRYEDHKKRLGWKAFVDAWIDGSLGDSTSVLSSHASVMGALRELMAPDGIAQEGLTIAITHDFYVHALLEMMSGRRKWSGSGIPTLAGVYLDYDDARYLLKAYGA